MWFFKIIGELLSILEKSITFELILDVMIMTQHVCKLIVNSFELHQLHSRDTS